MHDIATPQPGAGLDALFKARAIAVIGASEDHTKIGGRPVYFLRKYGYKGTVYPINPKGGTIQGYAAYTSVLDLPETPDMAIIAVPAGHAVNAVHDCAGKGVKAVIVLSSGFAEADAEGAARQQEMVSAARAANMRLLGPNCLGVVSVADGVVGSFTIVLEQNMPPAGNVGIVSQSGNIGSYTMQNMARRGLGISRFIATGNEADIDVADGIAALATDESTSVILCCMETCRDASRLTGALDLARRNGKPVIVIKIGSTESGQAAAASHTGALAGADNVIDAVFRRYGALRVHSLEELLEIGHAVSLLGPARLPKGPRVTLLAASGGFGIMMADATTRAGLTLPPLSDLTRQRIHEVLPLAGTNNPVDASAQMSSRPDILEGMLSALLNEPGTDTTLLFLSLSLYNSRLRGVYMQALAQVRRNHPDRLLAIISAGPADAIAEINALGIPVFASIDSAAKGLAALVQLGQLTALGPATSFHGERECLPAGAFGNEVAAKQQLAHAGISVLREEIVHSADEAAQCGTALGLPVVLKIVSPDIAHKTEIGGVMLHVQTREAVHDAYERIMANVARNAPGARIEGVLVTPMATGGVELIMGVSRDPVFGPVVMVGMGGIYAEVLQDVAVQVAPVSCEEALQMIRSLRMFPILDGARGMPKADIKAAAETVAALSEFACRFAPNVAEIDMNPVLVRPEGQGVVVLDALMVPVKESELTSGAH